MKNRAARATDLLSELVAGLFWMHLNLPQDVCSAELEGYADALIGSIRAGAVEGAIEQRLKILQTGELCQSVNPLAIKLLTRRIFAVVKASAVPEGAIPFMPLKKAA